MSPRALAETDKPLALTWVRAAIAAMERPNDPLTAAALATNFGFAHLGKYRRRRYRRRIERTSAVHVFDPRSGEADIHLSEWDPRFDVMTAERLVHNPSAYASFAAQIHTRSMAWPRAVRFGAGNPGT